MYYLITHYIEGPSLTGGHNAVGYEDYEDALYAARQVLTDNPYVTITVAKAVTICAANLKITEVPAR